MTGRHHLRTILLVQIGTWEFEFLAIMVKHLINDLNELAKYSQYKLY